MTDAQALDLVTQQIVRDGRSLLQYLGEVPTYTPPAADPQRHRLEAVARAEQIAIGKLIRLLQRRHATTPVLGAFPSTYTTINFTALEHLVPPLLRDEQQSIATLERNVAALPEGEVRHVLLGYLEMKKQHLCQLQEIAQADAAAERQQPSIVPSDRMTPAH